jgi:NtrC-family two-component system response regulator AlgB
MKILVAEADRNASAIWARFFEADGHSMLPASSPAAALKKAREDEPGLAFISEELEEGPLALLDGLQEARPEMPVVLYAREPAVESAKEAMRHGAMEYLQYPLEPGRIRGLLRSIEKESAAASEPEEPAPAEGSAPAEEPASAGPDEPAGEPPALFESDEPAMREPLRKAWKAAASESNVLLLGPSGTGKSVLAREMHNRSQRSGNPFVTIHCPSLSAELLESELFGHAKGAFTGATSDKVGSVATADGGTLFFDEIGELPPALQAKLLRLLQERQYERVGDPTVHTADVRVIAATNSDLGEAVRAGTFREDLYYRIKVVAIGLPPLSQRPGDIKRFARHLLEHFARREGREGLKLSAEAERMLVSHAWKGNLRELRNVIEAAVVLNETGRIRVDDLPECEDAIADENLGVGDYVGLNELAAEHIRRIIDKTETMEEAASVLGIDSATLYRKRKRMNMA